MYFNLTNGESENIGEYNYEIRDPLVENDNVEWHYVRKGYAIASESVIGVVKPISIKEAIQRLDWDLYYSSHVASNK